MWSVLIGPWRVCTVVPSTRGSRSRWTPSRETSGPWPLAPSREAILSISSRNTMPCCSVLATASRTTLSMSTSLAASSWTSMVKASVLLTEQGQEPVLGDALGPALHGLDLLLFDQVHGEVGQLLDHALHVAPHVAHLRELRGLHLDEGRVGQPRQAPRDLRLSHARG